MHHFRITASSIALLVHLPLQPHAPAFFASASKSVDSDGGDNVHHEQHPHLMGGAYGNGLRKKRYSYYDIDSIIEARDSRHDDNDKASSQQQPRRRPNKPGSAGNGNDDMTRQRPRRPGNNRPGRRPTPRDEIKAKRKEEKKKRKKQLANKNNKPNNSRPNRPGRPNTRPNNNNKPNRVPSKPSASSFGSNNSNNRPNDSGSGRDNGGGGGGNNKLSSTAQKAISTLSSISSTIDNSLFQYQAPGGGWEPSTIYKHAGLDKGLRVMNSQGVAGMTFYLGEDDNSALKRRRELVEGESSGDREQFEGESSKELGAGDDEEVGERVHRVLGGDDAYIYGLVNVAAFLAQSMKETIKYNACDENNWDLGEGGYPISNACGQLGQSYQDYVCPKGQEHMACEVDLDMEITAVTHAKWYGAPAPLFCKPKKNKDDFTGVWNYGYCCNNAWLDPPETCDVYEGQKAGAFENDKPVANKSGRTDVEGCCWWGRGVIQTTGICNFGKLNYYLGARAKREGRPTPYGEIDFCKDPEAICSSTKFDELKWLAGMFYWIESVQLYDVGGWNYMEELHRFVDGGMINRGFIDAVSGIVNRGCHNPPCGTGAVDGGMERYLNFIKALETFGIFGSKTEGSKSSGSSSSASSTGGSSNGSSGGLFCGTSRKDAKDSKCKNSCVSNLDCPDGQYCWNFIKC